MSLGWSLAASASASLDWPLDWAAIPLDPAVWLQRAIDALFALPTLITTTTDAPEELSWVLTLGCVFVLWLVAICICRWSWAFLQWGIAYALWIVLGGPLRLAMQRKSLTRGR